MNIVILRYGRNVRSAKIAEALAAAARVMGWPAQVRDDAPPPRADTLLAAYGWVHRDAFAAQAKAGGRFLYVDLGYWTRKLYQGDYDGLHKVVVGARHATGYFKRGRPHDRLDGAPEVRPWRATGRHIILAGMSGKGAASVGLQPYEWERRMIRQLRKVTDRPILYRPKPSWKQAQPLDGAAFSPRTEPIGVALVDAWALVTPHSNAALDALAAGVPIHAAEGLASVMSTPLDEIETPRRGGDVQQLLADIGYCHWTRSEIADGTMFRMLIEDGMLG